MLFQSLLLLLGMLYQQPVEDAQACLAKAESSQCDTEINLEPILLSRDLLFLLSGQLPAVAKKAVGLLEVLFQNFSFGEDQDENEGEKSVGQNTYNAGVLTGNVAHSVSNPIDLVYLLQML